MGVTKCQTIIQLLEEIAPKRYAESWDNVGLLVGDGSQKVERIMVCLDAPEWVIDEAIDSKVDMLVSHHPIIFSAIKRINTDNVLGRKIIKLIRNGISLYSMHTNYDVAKGGLNDLFAREMGFTSFENMETTYQERHYKLVVFVPKGYEAKVLDAMCTAGAGYIGKYSCCSFRSEGIGTFKPEEGTKPFIGEQGKLEQVEEYRVETIVPEKLLNKVKREMQKSHPYEEVAFDLIPLDNAVETVGLGRIAELEQETTLRMYSENIKKMLDADWVKVAGDPNKLIKKVAFLNGSGNKFINTARYAGADVLVTGDMQYHEIIDAVEMGLSIIDAGHFATEKIMIKAVTDYLRKKVELNRLKVEVMESKSNIEPLSII